MADTICKFCGKEVKPSEMGQSCTKSPNKKHILVPTGKHCVYCAKEVKPSEMGQSCTKSPTGKHQLAE